MMKIIIIVVFIITVVINIIVIIPITAFVINSMSDNIIDCRETEVITQ